MKQSVIYTYFRCVSEKDCNRVTEVTVRGGGLSDQEIIDTIAAQSDFATCPLSDDVCCHQDSIIIKPSKEKKNCADIIGHRYSYAK